MTLFIEKAQLDYLQSSLGFSVIKTYTYIYIIYKNNDTKKSA